MSTTVLVVIAIVVIILLVLAIWFLKNCLPKIIIGLIILAALAYLVYMYFIK